MTARQYGDRWHLNNNCAWLWFLASASFTVKNHGYDVQDCPACLSLSLSVSVAIPLSVSFHFSFYLYRHFPHWINNLFTTSVTFSTSLIKREMFRFIISLPFCATEPFQIYSRNIAKLILHVIDLNWGSNYTVWHTLDTLWIYFKYEWHSTQSSTTENGTPD